MAHALGAGLWDEEVAPKFAENTRAVLRLPQAEYQEVLLSVREIIGKSQEYYSIITS
jgi:hypothetical protein